MPKLKKRPASLAILSFVGLAAALVCFAAGKGDEGLLTAEKSITPAGLLSHIRILASDQFGGRAPGTPGEELTVAYLIAKCKSLGLKPGNPDGSYLQKVTLWGIRSQGTMTLSVKGADVPLTARQDYLLSSQMPKAEIAITKSPLVFVGYGVVAPEFHWDDYKGIDVQGKTVVLLTGDPPVPDANDPSKLDDKMFLGAALSYYGRPSTKYETAFAHGAVAAITLFVPRNGTNNVARLAQNTPRETMILRDESSLQRVGAQVSLSMEKASQLLAADGQSLDDLRSAAVKPGFTAVALTSEVTLQVSNTLREVDSSNVIARLDGSDAKLRNEYVIYSGHWDHLGTDGDRIYHGASDNAAGTAGVLELAKAFRKIKPAPKRSVLFLWPTAEEKGLLGAKYYVQHPLYPLNKTLADINLDYFSNWGWGRTKDISIVGLGNSTLDALVTQAASRQGRVVTGDTDPAEGFYFRSDHLEFAKGGVPSLETSPGIDYNGKPAGFGNSKRDEYIRNDYHKATDQVKPEWDLTGSVEDLQVLLEVGYRVAQADTKPAFHPDAPYQFGPKK